MPLHIMIRQLQKMILNLCAKLGIAIKMDLASFKIMHKQKNGFYKQLIWAIPRQCMKWANFTIMEIVCK